MKEKLQIWDVKISRCLNILTVLTVVWRKLFHPENTHTRSQTQKHTLKSQVFCKQFVGGMGENSGENSQTIITATILISNNNPTITTKVLHLWLLYNGKICLEKWLKMCMTDLKKITLFEIKISTGVSFNYVISQWWKKRKKLFHSWKEVKLKCKAWYFFVHFTNLIINVIYWCIKLYVQLD